MKSDNNRNEGAFSRWNILSLFGAKSTRVTPAAPAKPEPEPVLPPDARRILVVDDDPVVLKTTEVKLKKHGYAVTTAADGPSAIQAARSERPDLILLDLDFPADVSITWNGFSILSWLRRLEVTMNIPVIIVTGSQGNSLGGRAQAAGAVGLFHKPLNFEPLLELIDTHLKPGSSSQPGPVSATPKD